ncbi:MAG: alpha/beta family hydrolase [Bacteriovorax sp.]
MKKLIGVFLMLSSAIANANYTQKIATPRGEEIEVTIHQTGNAKSPTIVVAPGQSCNSLGPLFETIGKVGPTYGFNVVRFEWAYCLKDPTHPAPSADLQNEIEDFKSALNFAKNLSFVDSDKIIIAGKSLGSLVAYSIFKEMPTAKALALLTPICSVTTDDDGKPLPRPMNVCEEDYPGLKNEDRPVLMTMGDNDSACVLNVLFDYLKDSNGNVLVSVANGDHGFRVKNSDGSQDAVRTQRNIDTVVNNLFNWADLKINK